MSEIVRIEVVAIEGRSVRYVDAVTRVPGVADCGGHDLSGSTTAVVEIDRSRRRASIVRVLEGAAGAPVVPNAPVEAESSDHEAGVLVGGRPYERDPVIDQREIRVGQVRTAEIRFSSVRTAQRDRGRTEKRRPCVVVGVDGDMVAVSAIHGSNSSVRRDGKGRRLVGWRELGLRKPSFVSAETTWVDRDLIGELIGTLGLDDRRRLGLGEPGDAS